MSDIDFSNITINNASASEMKTGRWVLYKNGVELKIARQNNDLFTKKFIRLKRETDLSESEIMPIAMAGTILVDWRNFTMPVEDAEEVVEIGFSVNNAENLLKNDPLTFEYVQSYSLNAMNYVSKNVAKLKKKQVNI